MREMNKTEPMHLVARGTRCQHGVMSPAIPQRTFRLNEEQDEVWKAALKESGLSQQKAMETLVESLDARLIDLNALRAELIRRAREAKK